MSGEAPDIREQDCPSPAACCGACDLHTEAVGGATDGLRAGLAEMVESDEWRACEWSCKHSECEVVNEVTRLLAAHPAPSPVVPGSALLASFEHEDWCCAKGCACHVRPCPGCTCLVDIVRRHIEALTDAGEGWRSPAVPVDPPSGWYTFGTHAGWSPVPLVEFSDATGEDGMPLFERPVPPLAVPPAPTLAGLAETYRVGQHYGVHVYAGERPVATFFDPAEASGFVAAMNVPTVLTLAGLAEDEGVIEGVVDQMRLADHHTADDAPYETRLDRLARAAVSAILAHLSPPGVPDRSDAGDVL